MNDSRKKFDKSMGWAAFGVSYLIVLMLISMPFGTSGSGDGPEVRKEVTASLVADLR